MLIHLIERVPLTYYVILYVAVVALLGFAYYLLSPSPNGLVANGAKDSLPINFATALYFSLITVTTVGYGDIVPAGFSRALACFEALFGLTMMGLILAKLTSGRISYHVLRLFGSDAETRLSSFSTQFDTVQNELRLLAPRVRAFQGTPGTAAGTAQQEFVLAFTGAVGSFHTIALSFCRYLTDEMIEGYFFSDAPVGPLSRAGESLDQAVFVLAQLVISIAPDARILVLESQNRARITEALNRSRHICRQVSSSSGNAEIKARFNSVAEQCDTLAQSYFSAPLTPVELAPDQVVGAADQPQA